MYTPCSIQLCEIIYTQVLLKYSNCIYTVNYSRLMQVHLQMVMCYHFIVCLSQNIFFIKAIKTNEICV